MIIPLHKIFGQAYREGNPDAGGGSAGILDTPPVDNTTPPPAAPVDTPPADEPPQPFYTAVPDDWRTQLVDSMGLDDEGKASAVKMLERVTDLKSLGKNYFEAQNKIRSGLAQNTNVLADDATPEQVAEWREANGVPETPEGYELALDDGLVLGEEDNRIMGEVFKAAHGMNLSTDQMSQLTNAMLGAREAEAQAFIQQDGLDTQTAQRQLQDTWGPDYQTNLNMINGLVEQLPESIRDDFKSARLANGQALFNSPEVAVFLADVARKLNPAGTVVPNSNNPTQAITDEIKALEKRMGTDEWFKDSAAQKRYQDLVTAKGNMR